jgi:hypothetical protein
MRRGARDLAGKLINVEAWQLVAIKIMTSGEQMIRPGQEFTTLIRLLREQNCQRLFTGKETVR